MAGDLDPGDVVAGRFEIVTAISSGAMGAVYRARDEGGQPVALKRLVERRQAARFEIEGRLLTRLRHHRVVSVLEHLDDPTGSYLVMELVEGTDLAARLRQRGSPGLPVEEVLDYLTQACDALRYVHDQHVVHRDVKPHNLVLGEDGVTLVDFGIARELEGEEPGTQAIGTPLYMAPEVLVGEAVSPRSDVYGLGATGWALLTGSPPMYKDETRLAESVPGTGPELERTLRAALEVRPERRIASAEALAAALGSPLGASTGESLAVSVPSPPARRRLLEEVVRTAAGVFEAAAASIALVDPASRELVYQAAWGAGADEIAGVRLPPGRGIAGAVAAQGIGEAVGDCRADPRFAATIAAGTGYVPYTMLLAPLRRDGEVVGVLSVLDRRDAGSYGAADLERAGLFADLAVAALG